MLDKTRGIFLHAVKYSETSLIVTIYTEAYGRLSFIVNGVRSKKSVVKASVFQSLYLLEIEHYYQAGRDIQRLKNARIIAPYSSIPFDIRKSSQVIFLAEILYKCLREEEPNEELFNFVSNSLVFLDLSESGVNNFYIWFLFRFTQFLGILPSQDNALVGSFFDLQLAQFVGREPDHHQYADKHTTVLLSKLFSVDLSNIDSLGYTFSERREVLEKLLLFYKIHFDHLGEIKSLSILQEVLR